MNFLLPSVWIIIFLFIIWKHPFFKIKGIAQWFILGVFCCKLATSGILHFIFTNYYPDRSTADIFKYFEDAVVLFDSIHQSIGDFCKILFGLNCDAPEMSLYFQDTNHWTRMYEYAPFIDNRLIIRTNMIILLVSGGNIAVHYVFANFISLVGFLLIYKTFELFFQKNIIGLFIIFLLPSSLLWTAGILKECLVTFAIGCFVYGFFVLMKKNSEPNIASNEKKYLSTLQSLLYCTIGLLLLIVLKFYVLVALCPALFAFFLTQKLPTQKKWLWYVVVCFNGIILLGLLDFGVHAIPFFESFAGKRNDAINTALLYDAQSILPLEKIESTPWNFIKETPTAIWNTIALPYIWNFKGIIQLVPALESLLLFVLLGLMIFFYKKPNKQQANFVWFCVCFSLILIWEIGISTAVVGGIVRYKIPIFPLLYTTLALLIDWDRIIKKQFCLSKFFCHKLLNQNQLP